MVLALLVKSSVFGNGDGEEPPHGESHGRRRRPKKNIWGRPVWGRRWVTRVDTGHWGYMSICSSKQTKR